MDFDGSLKIISDLFEPYIDNNFKSFQKSYIYIISKVIDGKRFFKVGEGKRGISRLKAANTYLVPGLRNQFYQLHYLIFYDESPFPREFSDLIEHELHKLLRQEFPQYVIHFKNDLPSEWYLPRVQSDFLETVLGLIAVNHPKPREAYEFTKTNRRSILGALKGQKKYQKYAMDHVRIMNDLAASKQKAKQDRIANAGNLRYWKDKLIGLVFVDDGRNWQIDDVKYSPGIQRYLVEYAPSKPKNSAEKNGYESQLLEVLQFLTPRQRSKLDVEENLKYWEQVYNQTGKGQ